MKSFAKRTFDVAEMADAVVAAHIAGQETATVSAAVADEAQARSDAELNAAAAADADAAKTWTDRVADQAKTREVHTPQTKPHSNLKFTRRKSVAVPLFKLEPGQPIFVKVDGAMFLGKKVDEKKEAATLLPVVDLETGEEGQIIVGAVLRELFLEQYPDDAYVGKGFEITVRKRADKKYNTYDVFEIDWQA